MSVDGQNKSWKFGHYGGGARDMMVTKFVRNGKKFKANNLQIKVFAAQLSFFCFLGARVGAANRTALGPKVQFFFVFYEYHGNYVIGSTEVNVLLHIFFNLFYASFYVSSLFPSIYVLAMSFTHFANSFLSTGSLIMLFAHFIMLSMSS